MDILKKKKKKVQWFGQLVKRYIARVEFKLSDFYAIFYNPHCSPAFSTTLILDCTESLNMQLRLRPEGVLLKRLPL